MIGLFDSGVGGLTVAKAVAKKLPNVKMFYLGDTARAPYGNKSAEVVVQYGLEAARFLVEKGARILVVACNTVSAVGIPAIKKAFPDVPVFDVITPTIEAIVNKKFEIRNSTRLPARQEFEIKRVGVMGTRALVASGTYQKLLKERGDFAVIAKSAPLLVPLVEENWLGTPETKRIVKTYLRAFKQEQVDALVLACTHYPLLKKIITPRLSKRTVLIDPADETAKVLASWAEENKNLKGIFEEGESEFFVTDLNEQTQMIADKWLGNKVKLNKVSL